MRATGSRVEVRRELRIGARPETVWEFLVDEAKLLSWMGVSAVLEPRPGGAVRIEVISGNVVRGEVVEVDPPRRLVYTWGWESGSTEVPPGSTTVEFELVPDEGGTLLRFSHRDLPTAESAERHGDGWDHYLPRLRTAAAGGDPGRDTWLDNDNEGRE